jgi:hypothetical protein
MAATFTGSTQPTNQVKAQLRIQVGVINKSRTISPGSGALRVPNRIKFRSSGARAGSVFGHAFQKMIGFGNYASWLHCQSSPGLIGAAWCLGDIQPNIQSAITV